MTINQQWAKITALVTRLALVLLINLTGLRENSLAPAYAHQPTRAAPLQSNTPSQALPLQRGRPFFTPPEVPPLTAQTIITNASPYELAAVLGISITTILSATLNGSDGAGVGLGTAPLDQFPTSGDAFAILSTGFAGNADRPNNEPNLTAILGGLNNSEGNDLVQLALTLQVPAGINCASFDFTFYSEEYPEYVGNVYNDSFLAEVGGSNFVISGTQVIAPHNFAFDTAGNNISVNTVFTYLVTSTTTYDGRTSLLRASTVVTPGTATEFVFSVQDLGDSELDSTVFLDKFFWSNNSTCGQGAQEDMDGDGLLDLWETQGLTVTVGEAEVFVDLPGMGADPERKDVFVETDYMVEPGLCLPWLGCFFGHNHQPKPEAINLIVEAFANAPVLNPDGSTGINLHVDCGPQCVMDPVANTLWGNASQATALAHDSGLGAMCGGDCYSWDEFDVLKSANFSSERVPVFHYAIFAHNLADTLYSGVAREIGASDFIVSLGPSTNSVGTELEQAGTFMHELGHNLGLRHGGGDDLSYKPNYLSVMNYFFQFDGLIIDGSDGNFDYSRFILPNLDENALAEPVGLNGGAVIDTYGTRRFCFGADRRVVNANAPIDWNCDGDAADTGIQVDINKDTQLSVLTSYDDWVNLVFTGGAIGQPGAPLDPPATTVVNEPTYDELAQLASPYKVAVAAPGSTLFWPGVTASYSVTIFNLGTNTDTYTITSNSSLGWVDLGQIPVTLTLAAGISTTFSIPVSVPISANAGDTDVLNFSVTSQANPLMSDVARTTTNVAYRIELPVVLK
jgi:hypothetical protein